jgi:hypothetical protein
MPYQPFCFVFVPFSRKARIPTLRMVSRLPIRLDRNTSPKTFEMKLLSFRQLRRSANSVHMLQHSIPSTVAHFFTKQRVCIGLGLWHPWHRPWRNAPQSEQMSPQYASSTPCPLLSIRILLLSPGYILSGTLRCVNNAQTHPCFCANVTLIVGFTTLTPVVSR